MSSSQPQNRLRVAVIGGGMAGLVLTLFLQKHSPDVQVDIYESAQALSEVGAGIAMWPRVWEIVVQLGFEEELNEIASGSAGEKPSFTYYKGDQPEMQVAFPTKYLARTFHRSQLQTLFAKHIQNVDQVIHFGKRLSDYVAPASGTGEIILNFRDGTSATCDVVLGSDGIRSAVRHTMYEDMAKAASDEKAAAELRQVSVPIWSGNIVYRGLVPVEGLSEDMKADVVTWNRAFLGKNQHIVCYPIAQNKFINLASFVFTPEGEGTQYDGPWVSHVSAEAVVEKFGGWDPLIQTLMKGMCDPLAWAVNRLKKLPTFSSGRVALLGDAAHAMTPFQASGLGQAIEDGFVLASILSQTNVTVSNVASALKIYDKIRRPFAQNIQRLSDANGQCQHLRQGGWEDVTAEESLRGGFAQDRFDGVSELLASHMKWAQESSVMDDRDEALRMAKELTA
ncbi:FAD/NAD(P)-binding domain-containing protein [Epithele typhae]|uniref:FAD/NAD(P)-binding domain-containing protein n=1 Tax=Epithele typhae TaxID=378194 RepID=UPI0020087C37|nr:FAD/NAD(P)-binding domain-containing protein [Epithele typhae]KAH9933957.1 FAD/NAD(P)-binding domain-containing protein [Epithele typhae]